MAKFTAGPTVASISGSIGGTTFSHNRGGPYMRRRGIPVNPASARQLMRRAALGTISQNWQTLTRPQQDSWTNWARQNPIVDTLGQSILMSGQQSYIKLNTRLFQYALAQLTLPPIIPAPDALATLTLTADIGLGNFEIAFTATPLAANTSVWVRAALINSAGVRFVKNRYRDIMLTPAADASPTDIEAELTAVLGTPVVGQTCFVACGVFGRLTGLLSPPLIDSKVVVST